MKGFVSITIARRQSFACVIQPLNDRNFRYCWSMAFNSKAGTIARWASWNAYGISIKFHSLKRVSRSELGLFSGLQNMSFCKLTRRLWLHHQKNRFRKRNSRTPMLSRFIFFLLSQLYKRFICSTVYSFDFSTFRYITQCLKIFKLWRIWCFVCIVHCGKSYIFG